MFFLDTISARRTRVGKQCTEEVWYSLECFVRRVRAKSGIHFTFNDLRRLSLTFISFLLILMPLAWAAFRLQQADLIAHDASWSFYLFLQSRLRQLVFS